MPRPGRPPASEVPGRGPRALRVRLACAGACAAVTLTGCGAHRHAVSPARRRTSTSTTTTNTSTDTSTPATNTIAGRTATTSTTTAAALPGTGRPTVTIGDKNYTEQFVLGQLYLQALKAQGFSVEITDNIGPPAVVRQRLTTGTLAMYPEYLDTFNTTLAGDRRHFASRAATLRAARQWARPHGLRLLAPTPFSDTDAVAVTDAYAAAHRLRTLTGLRRVGATLTIGGALQFRTDAIGLRGLSDVYGVAPRSFAPLATGAVQAAYVNTTDGQLASDDYRVLADPRRLFGYGNVVPVASAHALALEGPAFAATIERVDRTLTLPVMRALNSEVDIAHETPAAVATVFLQTHGLLSPLRPTRH
jgi:osmoprotectant transport system substrate-binding protein